jgi:2-polyprenyl-3-methyl-5-hydroxy-6-metoxy-1,4-benzoquinol methylase
MLRGNKITRFGDPMNNTNSEFYHEELLNNTEKFWKKLIPVQVPYKLSLKHLKPGRTLEIGCGLGRNLKVLGGSSIGLDHNQMSVSYCQSKGLSAYTMEQFNEKGAGLGVSGSFDSLLLSHVLEHVDLDDQVELIQSYTSYLKPNAKIILITPQEKGFHSTSSHITWTDFPRLIEIMNSAAPDFMLRKQYSFPFPRKFGTVFPYNEFVTQFERRILS